MPEQTDEFESDSTDVTPVESSSSRSSKVDFLELRFDDLRRTVERVDEKVDEKTNVAIAYGVMSLYETRSLREEFRLSRVAAGEKESDLRAEVRAMENRVSDSGVKAAKATIKDYELGVANKELARREENATHWKRFWAEKGVTVAISIISFMALSLVALIVWIYVRGFR